MKLKGRRLYNIFATAVLLIGLAGLLTVGQIERTRQNEIRSTNRLLASYLMDYYANIFEMKIALLQFAMSGMRERGSDPGALKAVTEMYTNTVEAYDAVRKDYEKFMKENEPLRSLIPPFEKVYPELEEGAHLEMNSIPE